MTMTMALVKGWVQEASQGVGAEHPAGNFIVFRGVVVDGEQWC